MLHCLLRQVKKTAMLSAPIIVHKDQQMFCFAVMCCCLFNVAALIDARYIVIFNDQDEPDVHHTDSPFIHLLVKKGEQIL